jgi:type I restriction enzyme S subunit
MGEFVHKDKQNPSAPYPVYNGGTTYTGFYDQYNTIGPKVIISARGAAGFVNKVEGKFWAGNSCHVIEVKDENVLSWEYLYYALKSNENNLIGHQQKGGGVPAVSKVMISEISIPLPPIQIQKEIVRHLDVFANLLNNINDEIEARQKQLQIALNRYFEADINKVSIAELGKITRGRRFVRTDIVEQGTPCIHYGDIYTRYPVCVDTALTYLTGEITKKMRYAKSGDVVYVGAGENDEDIGMAIAWLGKEPAAVHDACYILSEHEQDAKYLAYMSRANDFHKQLKMSVASGKICAIPPDGLGRVKIPVPPIAEQRAIAEKLDTIEAFINNLKTERDLRQQQYEYYREYLINLLK